MRKFSKYTAESSLGRQRRQNPQEREWGLPRGGHPRAQPRTSRATGPTPCGALFRARVLRPVDAAEPRWCRRCSGRMEARKCPQRRGPGAPENRRAAHVSARGRETSATTSVKSFAVTTDVAKEAGSTLPGRSAGEESTCSVGDLGLTPGSGSCAGEGQPRPTSPSRLRLRPHGRGGGVGE